MSKNPQNKHDFIIFTGNSNPLLAKNVCEYMGMLLGDSNVGIFSDGEIQVEIKENVRRNEVYLIQSVCPPRTNDFLMELLIMADACKRSSVKKITAVIPYFGYARQDKKVKPRVPISAKLVMDLLEKAGVSKIITMDLHANQIQGFFDGPVDNLFAQPLTLKYIKNNFSGEYIIVSPDAGGAEMARSFANKLHVGLAVADKRRDKPNSAKVMQIIGKVTGKKCIIIDDMADTFGTMDEVANTLVENGASEVHACCTHPILSGPALDRVKNPNLKSLSVTDTIPLSDKAKICPKIQLMSVTELFGEAIVRDFAGESVSSLFE